MEYKRIRKESQQQILRISMALFSGNGYKNTTISQIAKEAGIAKGSVYTYFSSKESILKLILELGFIQMYGFAAVIDTPGSPKEKLGEYLYGYVQSLKNHLTYWQLFLTMNILGEKQTLLREVMSKHPLTIAPKLLSILRSLVKENLDEEFRYMNTLLQGWLYTYVQSAGKMDLTPQVLIYLDRFEAKEIQSTPSTT